MAKDIDVLKILADQIKNEVEDGKNTATRVGSLFGDVIDIIKDALSNSKHPVNVTNTTSGDLEFSDESGNVLVRFSNGHVKTKNFDSSNIPTSSSSPDLSGYQTKLVSGTNIKTINGLSILGSGNLQITGSGSSQSSTSSSLHLKVLIIGNSYSNDSWMYVPPILKTYGITISVGICYRAANYTEREVTDYNATEHYFYYIDTRSMTAWTRASGKTIRECVKYCEWDIITLQQSSSKSVTLSNYNPSVANLISLIKADCSKPFMLGWNINHTRSTSDQPSSVLTNCKSMYDTKPISIVFPYGTAIFDARKNSTLAAQGTGGNLWYSDGVHLQDGIGCYIASLAVIQALFDKFYPHLSVLNDQTRPTDAWTSSWNMVETVGCTGVTEANCYLAQQCAIMANKNKFSIVSI